MDALRVAGLGNVPVVVGGIVASTVPGVQAGDRGAVARALNLVEDRPPDSRPVIAALLRALGSGRAGGHRVGLTGPPGLARALLRALSPARYAGAEPRSECSPSIRPASGPAAPCWATVRASTHQCRTRAGSCARGRARWSRLCAAGGCDRPGRGLRPGRRRDGGLWPKRDGRRVRRGHGRHTVVLVVQPTSGDALQFAAAQAELLALLHPRASVSRTACPNPEISIAVRARIETLVRSSLPP